MKVITTEEFAKATKLDKLKMPGLAALLMELMKINQVNKLFAQAQPKQGPDFVDAILEGCGINIEFDERDLRNIPTTGGFIAIANHPYGGIEGMVLLKVLCMVRPDAKLMANFLLKKIPKRRVISRKLLLLLSGSRVSCYWQINIWCLVVQNMIYANANHRILEEIVIFLKFIFGLSNRRQVCDWTGRRGGNRGRAQSHQPRLNRLQIMLHLCEQG